MSAREPDVEALVRARLRERGWRITAETRRGVDLDWEVERAGTMARVQLRSPYAAPPPVPDAMLPPAFVRVDRGTADGRVEGWSVATAESEGEEEKDVGHQSVAGADWTSAAVGVGANATREQWRAAVDELLAAIERPRVGRSGATELVRVEPDPHAMSPWVSLLGVLIGGLSMAPCGAWIWLHDVEGREGAPAFYATAAAMIGAVLAFGGLRRWRRRRSTRVDAPSALTGVRSLPSVTAVDDRAEPCGRVAVITRTTSARAVGHADVKRRTLKARLRPRGASLTLSIWSCAYPDGTYAECRLLPEWTAVLRVHAPAELLARMPPGSRPAGRGEAAEWMVLDDAALAELLERVATVLREATPYR